MDVLQISPKRKDVAELLRQSDEYAASLYPEESNHLDDPEVLSGSNIYFVGVFQDKDLIGIGAVKVLFHDRAYGEIKRVFVAPEYRGKGISKLIMKMLENHLIEKGIRISRLETGIKQPEAIGLYKGLGYNERSPFGEYEPDPLSLFMEKVLVE